MPSRKCTRASTAFLNCSVSCTFNNKCCEFGKLVKFLLTHRHFIKAINDKIKFGFVSVFNKYCRHRGEQISFGRAYLKFVGQLVRLFFIQRTKGRERIACNRIRRVSCFFQKQIFIFCLLECAQISDGCCLNGAVRVIFSQIKQNRFHQLLLHQPVNPARWNSL